MENILAIFYLFVISIPVIKAFKNSDSSHLFNPIVFLSIYYGYYILVPFYSMKIDIYGGNRFDGVSLLLIAGIINYIGVFIGFFKSSPHKTFQNNNLYTDRNLLYLGILFLLIGALSYFAINGFRFNIIAVQTDYYDATEHRLGHTEQYVTMLVSLLPAAACLFYAKNKRISKILLCLTIIVASIIGIMGGSRYRLFLFFVPLVVFFHIFPNPKKINYKVWIPAALFFVFAMGVIEKTRNYGSGLDLDRMMEIFKNDDSSTKASETDLVYSFSAKVMRAYQSEDIIPIDVFGTALFLPLPRSLFPNKPDAQYLRDANIKTLGTDAYGAAYLNIVEWFLALGWLGVFLNGLLLGYLSRIFWDNYKQHPGSIGAALNLGMFDGICYILVSRGYLAQEFLMFMYYIPIVGWVAQLLLKFKTQKS